VVLVTGTRVFVTWTTWGAPPALRATSPASLGRVYFFVTFQLYFFVTFHRTGTGATRMPSMLVRTALGT